MVLLVIDQSAIIGFKLRAQIWMIWNFRDHTFRNRCMNFPLFGATSSEAMPEDSAEECPLTLWEPESQDRRNKGSNCPPPHILPGTKAKPFSSQGLGLSTAPLLDFWTFLRPCKCIRVRKAMRIRANRPNRKTAPRSLPENIIWPKRELEGCLVCMYKDKVKLFHLSLR